MLVLRESLKWRPRPGSRVWRYKMQQNPPDGYDTHAHMFTVAVLMTGPQRDVLTREAERRALYFTTYKRMVSG